MGLQGCGGDLPARESFSSPTMGLVSASQGACASVHSRSVPQTSPSVGQGRRAGRGRLFPFPQVS